jgi:hypothetical protein
MNMNLSDIHWILLVRSKLISRVDIQIFLIFTQHRFVHYPTTALTLKVLALALEYEPLKIFGLRIAHCTPSSCEPQLPLAYLVIATLGLCDDHVPTTT